MKVRLPVVLKNLFCSHERWTMDTQILTMRCDECGIFAWYNKEKADIYATQHQPPEQQAEEVR